MIITVRGIPAPQGSKRVNRAGAVFEHSKAVGPWREAVRAETQDQRATRTFVDGTPVVVEICFGLPRPKGHYRTGRNAHLLRPAAPKRPCGRPDLDKLARAVLDGLTAGGMWKDDSQVVALHVSKVYADAGDAGCSIFVEEVK